MVGRRALWLLLLLLAACDGPTTPVDGSVPDGAMPDAALADGGSDGGPGFLGVRPECNPLASTDECLFPFPSRFFQAADPSTPTGVRNAFPDDALTVPSSSPPLDYAPFNRPDGHSPTAPLLVHLGVDVDDSAARRSARHRASLVADAPIAVFDLETGDRVPILTEMDQKLRDARYDGRHLLIIRPMAPMQMGHRHVAVMTTRAPRRGRHADRDAARVLRRCATARRPTTPALEAARPAYDEIFASSPSNGYARDRAGLGLGLRGGQPGLRARRHPLHARAGLAAVDSAAATPSTTSKSRPNANSARIVEGDFEAPDLPRRKQRDPAHGDGGATLQPTMQTFPFTMIVPARASSGERSRW